MRARAVTRSISSSIRACTGWDSWTRRVGRCAGAARNPQVKVASVFSHLNCADMPEEDAYTRAQIALSRPHERPRRRFAALSGHPPYGQFGRHRALPRGAVRHVPPGLGLYGFGSEHNGRCVPFRRSERAIVQIKHLSAGDAVGMGAPENCTRPNYDGDRSRSVMPTGWTAIWAAAAGRCWWPGGPAPIVGRVCMDSCMIDITDIPASARATK